MDIFYINEWIKHYISYLQFLHFNAKHNSALSLECNPALLYTTLYSVLSHTYWQIYMMYLWMRYIMYLLNTLKVIECSQEITSEHTAAVPVNAIFNN